ncbi:MAG: thioredoxin-disulfide reductase [Sphingobacteriales bacterium]|jgi:thioredoxin reductase (NADPH)|nr:thioredoxin-disulfide reductase [Sphingobacteriales bacterium]MBP9141395.1 thioredoxin-disulfide reductase [Chitinophagales bacterium]MBK6890150.1 thioredoxin-disulfide reductase [Sphingobacteriales bacterium]MBK7527324.1 thioredoxin-disulfide reductase [Sphingobacteriales bacterium]MBK8678328.1 thioredoxin-disulfide reductase [Sphingobacteriales bacterium]
MQQNNNTEHIPCLIIGSGPAGYTAAIYAARANLKPVLYTGLKMGGQLMDTTDVENFPGYPKGIMGPQLMEDFRQQAEHMGTDIRFGIVERVDFSGTAHKIWLDDGQLFTADAVIIATGASAKWLGLPSELRLRDAGGGVSACAVCDGSFFRNQEVAIVGAGDTAAEEALYLAKMCKTVHMLVRRNEMRASKVMQARVLSTPNIKLYWNTETEEVLGNDKDQVVGIKISNNKTNELSEIAITGFFVAIGHEPNTTLFRGWLDMDHEGYLITKQGSTKTNIPGIFACGDAQDKIYRQAVTAAGTGCMAALDAERYLSYQAYLKTQALLEPTLSTPTT